MATGIMDTRYTGIPALLYEPDIRAGIVKRYRDDDFIHYLDEKGAWVKRNDTKFYTAYETPLVEATVTTGAVVTGSGSATVTITDISVAESGKLIPNKIVNLANGQQALVVSVVTTAGKDTVVLRSSAAGTPNLTVVAGDTLYPAGNAQEEGSLEPRPERWGLTTSFNLMEVFRKTGGVTDIQRARHAGSFKVELGGGGTQDFSWANARTLMSHRADIAIGCLTHKMSDPNWDMGVTPTLTGTKGYGIQVTNGLLPTITQYGWSANFATPGTPTMVDLENINAAITQKRGASEYMVVGTNAAITRFSSFLKGFFSGMAPVRMNVDGREIDLTVETYTLGGITFHLSRFNTFDNTAWFPATGEVAKNVYFIPMGTTQAYASNGAESSMEYLSMGYLPVIRPGSGNEREAEVHLGALSETPNSGEAVENVVYETICAPDIANPYIFGRAKVLA